VGGPQPAHVRAPGRAHGQLQLRAGRSQQAGGVRRARPRQLGVRPGSAVAGGRRVRPRRRAAAPRPPVRAPQHRSGPRRGGGTGRPGVGRVPSAAGPRRRPAALDLPLVVGGVLVGPAVRRPRRRPAARPRPGLAARVPGRARHAGRRGRVRPVALPSPVGRRGHHPRRRRTRNRGWRSAVAATWWRRGRESRWRR
jgi:hypothetical protein